MKKKVGFCLQLSSLAGVYSYELKIRSSVKKTTTMIDPSILYLKLENEKCFIFPETFEFLF